MSSNIELQDAMKGSPEEHDKIISPKETIKRFKEKARQSGLNILEHTNRIDNGRLGIPVYFSICGEDAQSAIGSKKQMGKGATPALAEASAVMELAERFSVFTFKDNPDNFIVDTYTNVKDKAIPFEMILKSVHDDSGEVNVLEEIFSELTLKWTWGYNLTQKKDVLIPFDWFYTINEFNGSSAGNSSEEAICQGLCELAERHVCAIISRDRKKTPQIDPSSVTDKASCEMLEKYKENGINIHMSDFSLDTGIPTVGIMAWDPSTFPETSEIVWTAGTAPEPQRALSRALTEVAQLAGDFNTDANYVASGLPKFSSLPEADFITNPDKTTKITDLPDTSNTNIKQEIENCTESLAKKGLEVLTINTRHPKLDIPAFYTIIPGAHFRERALNSNVGMFTARHIADTLNPLEAFEKLTLIDSKLPDKYYINFYLGISCLSLYNPEKALGYFEKALGLDPDDQDAPSICSYMGSCLKDLALYERAIGVLKKGIDIDGEREDIYNLMGVCYFKLKKHEKAIQCFQSVLELNPGSGIEYANIASNYRDLGKIDKAVTYYKIALEFDPTLDFARENLEKLSHPAV